MWGSSAWRAPRSTFAPHNGSGSAEAAGYTMDELRAHWHQLLENPAFKVETLPCSECRKRQARNESPRDDCPGCAGFSTVVRDFTDRVWTGPEILQCVVDSLRSHAPEDSHEPPTQQAA